MTKLRIKPLPYDKTVGGVVWYEKTTHSTEGKRALGDARAETLLSEAIRFYNYGLDIRRAGLGPAGFEFHKDRKQWIPLNPKVMQSAMTELCLALRDALTDTAEALINKETLKLHLKSEAIKRFPLGLSSNRALLAAHLFLADGYRAGGNERQPRWLARDFERLEQRLVELRSLIKRDAIERNIAQHYSKKLLPGAKLDEFFFNAYWGGRWLIRPAEEFYYPQRPFYPHNAREVGPTEKLHVGLISQVFEPQKIVVYHAPEGGSLTDFDFLSDVYKHALQVERILPNIDSTKPPDNEWRRLKNKSGEPPDKRGYALRTQVWHEWRNNLRLLELLFAHAIDTKYVKLGVERYPGVIVGLPCALALIGVLRAYLADLMGRALMVALSMAINEIYTRVNGYLGVALWEALSGQDAEGVLHKGCLTWLEDNGAPTNGSRLLGCLANWREQPVPAQDFWGTGEPVHRAARATLADLLAAPLVKPGVQRPKYTHAVKKVASPIGFWQFKKHLRRYPPLGATLGIDRALNSDWLFGARFAAQAHLFVAHQINAKAAQRLWLAWEEKNKYKMPLLPHRPGRPKRKKPRWDNFKLTAGSYGWAGRKPPHLTHVEGVNFDIVFGPDIVPFPNATGLGRAVNRCNTAQSKKSKQQRQAYYQAKREIVKYAQGKGVKPYFLYKPAVVCYTPGQVELAKENLPFRPMVYRQLITKEIDKRRSDLFEQFYDKTLAGEAVDIDDETLTYELIEMELIGTPHFMDTEEAITALMSPRYATEVPDWQRTHGGHVAIMLSAPRAIVFASPIVHFRAMRAIRSAFYDKDPELFQLATKLIKQVYFDFKPHDHHNHWHVNYHHNNAIRRLEENFKLWMALGVDMGPFVDYLRSYRIIGIADPALRKAVEAERDQVLLVCQEYELARQQYMEEHGSEVSEKLLDDLFTEFTPDGWLITPTITARQADQIGRTSVLADAYASTRDVVEKIVILLKSYGCDTRGIYEASLWADETLEEALTSEEAYEVLEEEDEE